MESTIVVKINGEDIGFQFTMLTLEKICERQGIDYYELLEHASRKPFGVMNSILACGNAVYEKKKPVDEYMADDWITEMDQEELQRLWDHFEKSLINIIQRMEAMRHKEEEVKKK